MDISNIIDGYNHSMNGVNRGDQLHANFDMHSINRKNWKLLLYMLLNIVVSNAYLLGFYALGQQAGKQVWNNHRKF